MSGRVTGRTALVTGAASGLGRACAVALARNGAAVVLGDLDEDGLKETLAIVHSEAPDSPHPLVCTIDVTESDTLDAAVQAAEESFGGLDVLVANAGIDGTGSVTDTSLAAWERVMRVNATGVFLSLRAALPALIRAGNGSAILQASTAAMVGVPGLAAYSAAKGAVVALARQAAVEYGRQGVRVNALCPGTVPTELVRRTLIERSVAGTPEEALEAAARSYPMRRLGDPEDVAQAVVYLASTESAWITGTAIPVDGGYTAR